ncbi:response regulator transcription factor [Odoribacter sp. OttesenSCG-928-J03]|nr:response regulator transcription factor [Odoribacter sp. OttesenSCG-928-J03]MDL2283189.1 response regulator transcription factor [Odoribacter sp. OttesenSCG-928-G04]
MDNNVIKIAIAETSMIIRSGIATILKSMPGFKILPIEIYKPGHLQDALSLHKPDVLIINPFFVGHTDILKLQEDSKFEKMKYIALICTVGDKSMIKDYNASITLYDEPEDIHAVIAEMLNAQFKEEDIEDPANEQETLSVREKEIIACVAKGFTNKEIADQLFLSTHTVITHRRNITRKLQIHSPAGLTIYAIVNKLIELQDIKDKLS